ncbi:hypothetical protein DACRYDRAFT_75873 [Dacryopinax primogenitus]|uniref:Pyridoxal phosphate homeostasis protein n=1 Tax=Dacryopinax primogenitus (strain DJM 731) TaxID=1858805 RepID=M5G7Z8_DACPD|nr:uncharacterized protein DACRYDRAFT_75873 [Dacryopinax primogenitus]EJU04884.1 hypothetical protein DACRYDRAFT_75873 [Dacryopinax primogenitus]
MSTSDYPRPSSERIAELRENLEAIRAKINVVVSSAGLGDKKPNLVAVSKIKSAEDVMACYEDGQLHFGENYVQELIEKAEKLPQEIKWHFIGALQSNKCKPLASIPNLYAVETLDSIKKADVFQKSLPDARSIPLRVFIQINTSSEESKSGLPPVSSTSSGSEAVELAKHIVQKCPALHLEGLMTIGSIEASTTQDENEDFDRLRDSRDNMEKTLREAGLLEGWGQDGKLQLSMGMSADFENAIMQGSDSVRVGSSIFGARPKKQ